MLKLDPLLQEYGDIDEPEPILYQSDDFRIRVMKVRSLTDRVELAQ